MVFPTGLQTGRPYPGTGAIDRRSKSIIAADSRGRSLLVFGDSKLGDRAVIVIGLWAETPPPRAVVTAQKRRAADAAGFCATRHPLGLVMSAASVVKARDAQYLRAARARGMSAVEAGITTRGTLGNEGFGREGRGTKRNRIEKPRHQKASERSSEKQQEKPRGAVELLAHIPQW